MGTGQPTLADTRPDLAAQWHPSLNGGSTPEDVTCGSSRKVWWLCKDGRCGHEHAWQARVSNRVYRKRGCPICSGREPCDCNSLAALHPRTAQQQWYFERNEIKPEQLLPRSHKQVHWRCTLHSPPHLWTARPNSRFGVPQSGCPECARLRRITPQAQRLAAHEAQVRTPGSCAGHVFSSCSKAKLSAQVWPRLLYPDQLACRSIYSCICSHRVLMHFSHGPH